MHINLSYQLDLQLSEFTDVQRRATLAITQFQERFGSLDSKPWSLTFIDKADDKLFQNLGEHDRVIWISNRVETVPPKVIVSVPEDVFERTVEALEQIFFEQ
ncbi:hypothetical protein EPO17_02265 [Patescibacteria group bacterium]|nr:MAG: hypothetical protein EPO17_02265 [Patescibacteria group bacterium]